MAERLLSVGLDVGTSTTQLVVSHLTVEDRASGFTVPRLEITDRQVVYESPIHFTPLLGPDLVDGEGIRAIVEAEYRSAGIEAVSVDTGAVIITGETSRKENARSVLKALSQQAGKFVVATAGPDLESVLAARGAGADAQARDTGRTFLHMDIGGGTSNLALCTQESVRPAGCLNVGGRLAKFDPEGHVTYVSPVLRGLVPWELGDTVTEKEAMTLAEALASALEMAAGLRQRTDLLEKLSTAGAVAINPEPGAIPSFSGGVADCIRQDFPWLQFGDLGPLLGRAIRESRLCAGEYRLGSRTIRATVIGAGCHSASLSGSTVFLRGQALPIQDLPAAHISFKEQQLPPEALSNLIRSRLGSLEGPGVLTLPGWQAPDYAAVTGLADAISGGIQGPCRVALKWDMAKALGHALALRLPKETPILCLDGLDIPPDSYLDAGTPIGPAVPVVVKTLAFTPAQETRLKI